MPSVQPSDTCPQVGGREVLEWSVEHVSRDMEAASLVREAALQHEVSIEVLTIFSARLC